jgi:hypothetical protein
LKQYWFVSEIDRPDGHEWYLPNGIVQEEEKTFRGFDKRGSGEWLLGCRVYIFNRGDSLRSAMELFLF